MSDLSHCLRQFRQFSDLEVSKQQFENRIRACEICSQRTDTQCQEHAKHCAVFSKQKANWCKLWGEPKPPEPDRLKEWREEVEGKPIRLGVCTPTLSMGGITRVLLTMMTAPVDNGIEWSGFAIDNPWTFDLETAKLILKHCPIYSTRNNPAYKGLVTIVPNAHQTVIDRSDVVNPCGYTQSCAELDAANWDSVPLLIVAHGQCEWTRKSLAVSLSKGTKHILASVSTGGVKCFPEDVRDRVGVIYNGVDFSRCASAVDRETTRQKWGIGTDTKAVGYIGRFAYGKKPLAAAEAVAELGDGYQAVYVGEGNQQDQMIEDVKERCGDRVTILPRTEDVGTVLAALDCMVSASPSEGGPLSVIESWIAGCPVVSTSVGVIPELEGEHGPLTNAIPFDPSPQELADAVREAIGDDTRIERAKEMAWKLFPSTRMLLDYEALLRGNYAS